MKWCGYSCWLTKLNYFMNNCFSFIKRVVGVNLFVEICVDFVENNVFYQKRYKQVGGKWHLLKSRKFKNRVTCSNITNFPESKIIFLILKVHVYFFILFRKMISSKSYYLKLLNREELRKSRWVWVTRKNKTILSGSLQWYFDRKILLIAPHLPIR